jgi:hypothetical protein
VAVVQLKAVADVLQKASVNLQIIDDGCMAEAIETIMDELVIV